MTATYYECSPAWHRAAPALSTSSQGINRHQDAWYGYHAATRAN